MKGKSGRGIDGMTKAEADPILEYLCEYTRAFWVATCIPVISIFVRVRASV